MYNQICCHNVKVQYNIKILKIFLILFVIIVNELYQPAKYLIFERLPFVELQNQQILNYLYTKGY